RRPERRDAGRGRQSRERRQARQQHQGGGRGRTEARRVGQGGGDQQGGLRPWPLQIPWPHQGVGGGSSCGRDSVLEPHRTYKSYGTYRSYCLKETLMGRERETRQDGFDDYVVKIRRCAAVVKGG